jgi:hypothetical protein
MLRALGQVSDTSSYNDESDLEEEDTVNENHFSIHPSSHNSSGRRRMGSFASLSQSIRAPENNHDNNNNGQDSRGRTRFACAQQQQQLQLLQEYHDQMQQQQQQQRGRRGQRVSWNRRFFSNLWGNNGHSSGHTHQLPLSVTTT